MSPEFASRGAGRYAPSPSGDLHLGNLRTALVAWLFARTSGRRFLMRIEDLDRDRDAGSAPAQLRDLAAIGIDWDEPLVTQSHRIPRYAAVLADLTERGLVYECYCTRRDILSAPTAPHAPPGAYPGTCRRLSDAERIAARARISPRRPALRLRSPEPGTGDAPGVSEDGTLRYRDEILGEVVGAVDDFVLQRGDGTVAYNLAVVVDDADTGIDQVVRGDDLAPLTSRQIVLQRLLGFPQPVYAHVSLVLGPGGARLAKRDGAVTLQELIAEGATPEGVLSSLATSLGLARAGEAVTAAQLGERFDPARLPRTPWMWEPRPAWS